MFHIADLKRFKNLIKDLIEKFVPERLKKYTGLSYFEQFCNVSHALVKMKKPRAQLFSCRARETCIFFSAIFTPSFQFNSYSLSSSHSETPQNKENWWRDVQRNRLIFGRWTIIMASKGHSPGESMRDVCEIVTRRWLMKIPQSRAFSASAKLIYRRSADFSTTSRSRSSVYERE